MRRRVAIAAFIANAVAGAACVDLFHSTDFDTFCSVNPSACIDAADAAPTSEDSSDAPRSGLCASSSAEARARAESVCARLGACAGASEDLSFGKCMMHALAAYDCAFNPTLRPRGSTAALWTCLAERGNTCDEVNTCIFGNPVGQGCAQTGGGTYRACAADGSAVIVCGSGGKRLATESCVLRGRSCAADGNRLVVQCTGSLQCRSSAPACNGTSVIRCEDAGLFGVDEGHDCAAYGDGRCVLDSRGAACAPSDAGACTKATSELTCDGGVLESCVGGAAVRVDCTAIQQLCVPAASVVDPARACVNPDAGGRCDERQPDTCAGTMLRSCAQGTPFNVDCKLQGLSGCAPGDAGASATCTP